jgi:hypothetical protein
VAPQVKMNRTAWEKVAAVGEAQTVAAFAIAAGQKSLAPKKWLASSKKGSGKQASAIPPVMYRPERLLSPNVAIDQKGGRRVSFTDNLCESANGRGENASHPHRR